MFDLDKNLFITNTNDLIEAIKQKKLLTMRNCQNYAKRIIDRLREEEEEERYKLGKNINLDNDKDNNDKSNNVKASNDIKEGGSKEKQNTSSSNESILKLEIYQFKKNSNCDIFAEEFIS